MTTEAGDDPFEGVVDDQMPAASDPHVVLIVGTVGRDNKIWANVIGPHPNRQSAVNEANRLRRGIKRKGEVAAGLSVLVRPFLFGPNEAEL